MGSKEEKGPDYCFRFDAERILAGSLSLEGRLSKLLQSICEGTGWPLAELWNVDSQAGLLRWRQNWCDSSVDARHIRTVSASTTFQPGAGLPGRAWKEGRLVYMADVSSDPSFKRTMSAAWNGLHGAFALPIGIERGIVAVMAFFSHDVGPPDARLVEAMTDVARHVGLALNPGMHHGEHGAHG